MSPRTTWLLSIGLCVVTVAAYLTSQDLRTGRLQSRTLRVEQLTQQRDELQAIVDRLEVERERLASFDERITRAQAKLPPRSDRDPFQARVKTLAAQTSGVELVQLMETGHEDGTYAHRVSFLFELRGKPAAIDGFLAALRRDPHMHTYTMVQAELGDGPEITLRVTGESLQSL